MPILFPPLLLILLIGSVVFAAEEVTPLQQAQAAFEAERDDEHRKRMRLTWHAVDKPMPEMLDVLVLRGYLNHDLLMMQWRNGTVTASVATVDRQWFYHPKANARSYATVNLPAEDFIRLWKSMQMLITVQATEIIEPGTEPETGGQLTRGTSSHAPYHLLTWTSDPHAAWSSLPVLRGSSSRNGIRDLDELKMAAISKLVWGRFPETAWTPDPGNQSAERWHSWWHILLPGCRGDGTTPVSERTRLLVENACEMLGDVGDATDATLLTSIADSLRPAQPRVGDACTSPTYYEDSLRTAIAQCVQRIALRSQWDSATATRSIHANNGRTHTGNDQERWLREQFHQHDPEHYRTLLLEDLHVAESNLVVTSIGELLRRHPGEHRDDLQHLLQRDEPSIVLASALALMGKPVADYGWHVRPEFTDLCTRSKDDPLLRDALAALEHLANDPTVPVAPGTYWFNPNPRTGAMQVLSACPLPWGWDVPRHQRQLDNLNETDGRVIAHLVRRVGLPMVSPYTSRPPQITATDRATLIAIWRRCLVTPLTRGTVLAMEELIGLHDVDSLPRLNQLRDLLRTGASGRPVPNGDDDRARLPWISTYEVDDVDKKLKTLSGPSPMP